MHELTETDMDKFRETEDLDIFIPNDFKDVDFAKLYISLFIDNQRDARELFDSVFGENSYEDFLQEHEGMYNSKFNHKDNDGVPKIDALRWLNGFTLSTIPKEDLVICNTRISVATKEALLQMKSDTIRFFEMTGGMGSGRVQDYIDASLLKRLIGNA